MTATVLCVCVAATSWPLAALPFTLRSPQYAGLRATSLQTLPFTVPASVPPLQPISPAHKRWDSSLRAQPRRGQFVRFFRMTATAYMPIPTRMEGGRYTVTERDGRAVHGIAVDPDLIPLGSRLWVPGYGHAVADDIGGRIRGHHVDLRVQERGKMETWGRRAARVYVLSDPPAQQAAGAPGRGE